MNFDFIIIGGGSAGCVLANRLTENAKLNVLLIEAGDSGKHPFVRVPAASGQAIFSPRFNWMYMAEPDSSRGDQVDMWPAGKTLGGSSAINGMMFVRGHAYDYNLWAQMGATGWSYDDVLPYFRKIETFERGADDYRGGEGPIHVSDVRAPNPLTDLWFQSAINYGVPRSEDLNGLIAEGVDYVQSSQKKGWRHSSSAAYLWPIQKRRNLRVMPNTKVLRIIIENKTAKAVEIETATGQRDVIPAARGVISSAGAIASPKLLKLSGIGPAQELNALGLKVIIDNASVGENLQEHPAVRMGHAVAIPSIGSNETLFSNIKHGLNFLLRGRGPLSTGIGHAQAMVRTSSSYDVPNIQIVMSPFAIDFDDSGPHLARQPAVGIAVGLARTETRGRILLRSAQAEDQPIIDYKMLASQHDVDQLIEGCKIARGISRTKPFADIRLADRAPDEDMSDEGWEEYVRHASFGMYHACGTCRMGAETNAVTGPDLRVHGMKNLWVIDASVFPHLPAGNINASVFMVAEKGADMIKSHLANSPSPRSA